MKHHLTTFSEDNIERGIHLLINSSHGNAIRAGWWHGPRSKKKIKRNKGEMLMLIVSEVSEAMEGERKNLMDDKLPHRKMVEVELADACIRIADYCGAHNLDLGGAITEKMRYNLTRADHKPANRRKANGKKW